MQQENKHKGQVASTRPSLRRSLEVRIRGRSTRVPPPPRHRACALARVCGPKRRRGVCVWYVEGVCLCASGKGTFGSNNSSKQRPLPTPRLTGSTPWRGAHACAAHTYPTTTSFTVSMKVNWSTAAACVPLKGEENSKTPSRNIFINRYIVQFKPCEVRSSSRAKGDSGSTGSEGKAGATGVAGATTAHASPSHPPGHPCCGRRAALAGVPQVHRPFLSSGHIPKPCNDGRRFSSPSATPARPSPDHSRERGGAGTGDGAP